MNEGARTELAIQLDCCDGAWVILDEFPLLKQFPRNEEQIPETETWAGSEEQKKTPRNKIEIER